MYDEADVLASRPSADAQELVVLRKLVTVYRQLSSMAAQNASLHAVADLIAVRTDSTVAIVDQNLNILTVAAPNRSSGSGGAGMADGDVITGVNAYLADPRLNQVLQAAGRSRTALVLPETGSTGAAIVAPVLVGEDVPAYVLTTDTGERGIDEDGRLLLTEHAATVCGVILGRDQIIAVAASRARDDLVEGLLYSRGTDSEEVNRWSKHLGYDSDEDHRVMSIVPEPTDGDLIGNPPGPRIERTLVVLERMLSMQAPAAIVSVRDSEVVVVLRQAGNSTGAAAVADAKRLGELCLRRVHESFPDVSITIGLGSVCRAAAEIAQSYADARRTVDTARRMGRRGQIVAFEDLGIHRLLLERADIAQLRAFARETFGSLVTRRPEYLSTLACYFRENASPQRASRQLHVHANTVAYRIRRVEELTGLDLGNYRDRLVAQVALEILEAVGADESAKEATTL